MAQSPAEWMNDKVQEWEQQQVAMKAASEKSEIPIVEPEIDVPYEFMGSEVRAFEADIVQRQEYIEKQKEIPVVTVEPVTQKTVEFMKNDVEIFEKGVVETLENQHKRTCSTCSPRESDEPKHSMEFMKEEVAKFKKDMNM